MGHSFKPVIILFFLIGILASSVQGQNYRDQKKLIRLKPNNLLVFGQVQSPDGESVTGTSISLFDPSGAKIIETIPVDDLGEYLFTLEKGKTFGLIVEKEGFFPYYTQFTVPRDLDEEWENAINLPEGLKNHYSLFYIDESDSPSNQDVLDELLNALSKYQDLYIWIPEESDTYFSNRSNSIRNSFTEAGIQTHRILAGSPPADVNQFINLRLINENSPEDNLNPADTVNTEDIDENIKSEDPVSENDISPNKWTLQFTASKNELSETVLKGLTDYKVFKGKDGYYRYTYGTYNSKEEAGSGKAFLKGKGFSQSFAKKIEDLQKL